MSAMSAGSSDQTLAITPRSEEHTSELQSRPHLVCRLLLEKKKKVQVNCSASGNLHATQGTMPAYEIGLESGEHLREVRATATGCTRAVRSPCIAELALAGA